MVDPIFKIVPMCTVVIPVHRDIPELVRNRKAQGDNYHHPQKRPGGYETSTRTTRAQNSSQTVSERCYEQTLVRLHGLGSLLYALGIVQNGVCHSGTPLVCYCMPLTQLIWLTEGSD